MVMPGRNIQDKSEGVVTLHRRNPTLIFFLFIQTSQVYHRQNPTIKSHYISKDIVSNFCNMTRDVEEHPTV